MKAKIVIEGLYRAGYNAYSNISFYPEKRAEAIVSDYESILNTDLQAIPEEEKERYVENFKRYLFRWLAAKSRCFSVMITGGGNFNNRAHDKANNSEHKRYEEFTEWREKAIKSIAKRIEQNKTEEQKTDEKLTRLRAEITQKMEWGSIANAYSMLERLAYNGEVELINEMIILITEWNDTHKAPFVTKRHKLWLLPEIATKCRDKKEAKKEKSSKETEINGIKVVENYEADRIQLFFEGKPEREMIDKLKKNAFRWSPSNGCWQRQLTNNAICATNHLLK